MTETATETPSEARPPGASRRSPSGRPPTAQVAKIIAAGLTATAVLGLTTAYGWSARFAPPDDLATVPAPAPAAAAAPTPPIAPAPLAPGTLAPVAATPAPIPLAVPAPPAAAQSAPAAQSAGS